MKRYGLSCFVLLGLLGHANDSLLLADPPATLRVGLGRDSDLFECLPGDNVRLEEAEGATAMRWEVNYVDKQYRMCVKEIEAGTASGMTTMNLRLRADARHQLWLQINEKSGEKFYRIITAELKWRELVEVGYLGCGCGVDRLHGSAARFSTGVHKKTSPWPSMLSRR